MILPRLRQELAFRSLQWWIPVALGMGLYLWWMGMRPEAATEGLRELYLATVFVWGPFTIYFLNAGYASRSSSAFDLALPVSTRRLWLVHVSTIVICGWAILGVLTGVVAMGNLSLDRRPLVGADLLDIVVHLGAGLVLALALTQSPRPTLQQLPSRASYHWFAALVVGGYLGLTLLLLSASRLAALVPLTIGIALGLRTYLALPPALRVASLEPEPASPLVPRASGEVGALQPTRPRQNPRFDWLLHSTIWRASPGNIAWSFPVALAYHGFVLGYGKAHELKIPYLFFTLVLLGCWLMISLRRLHRLDPLAVSRRRIFAVLSIPVLLAVVLGYGTASVAEAFLGSSVSDVDYRESACCYQIRVPGSYWGITWDGEAAEIGSPWGESLQPVGQTLVRGWSINVYDPYGVGVDSSPGFVALQLSRSIEAVYGTRIPFDELRDRYLEVGPDTHTRLKAAGFALLDDYPELRARGAGRRFPIVMLAVALPWFLFSALAYRAHRGGVFGRYANVLIVGLFALGVLVGVGLVALQSAGLIDLESISRFSDILIRQAVERLPGGTLTLWGMVALALVASYRLAESQFSRVEAPVGRQARC
jgi:hypothetical protein